MARLMLLDELQVVVRVPAHLPTAQLRAIRRTLANRQWLQRLRRSVQASFRTTPTLSLCRVDVTR